MVTVKCRKLQYLGHIMRNKRKYYDVLRFILQKTAKDHPKEEEHHG